MSEDRGMNRMTSERFWHLGENWTKIGMEEGFPGSSDSKESAYNARDLGLISGLGRSPGEGNGKLFLPGEFHGQRSLEGYSPWGHKESDMTE